MVVGDSIANLLVIEAILYDLDLSVEQFSKIYEENPSKLHKINVKDRSKFITIDDESRLISPPEIQLDIDQQVGLVQEGKAFVRPSGTEDILRLYAEAKTQEEMENLANSILHLFQTKYQHF